MRFRKAASIAAGLLCLGALLSGAEPQPYDKVVTKEAKTTTGVFIVHKIGDEYYYEIPKDQFDHEFLWNARVSQTAEGVGFGGFLVADRVVRWELSGQRVLLRDVSYEAIAGPRTPMEAAVKASNTDIVVMAFDVLAISPAGAPVIDVTRLFTSDVAEFGIKTRLGAANLDGARTWVNRVSAYPRNIEVEATQTWVRTEQSVVPGQMRPGDATIVVHHSMVQLPPHPMMARLYDDRVGFFQSGYYDYSSGDQRARHLAIIDRWRLEKKDPNAAVSEPVHPIVFYIDPATPAKWRDSIRKAAAEWLPALEGAGFRNAIVVRDPPDPSEDPEFSPEDVRYSVIRWLPSTTRNAFGPNVHDPRTGEILNSDIEIYHNVMALARMWAFIQTAVLDPGASRLPLSDETMGRAIQAIVAHEIGHALGLEHNLKASSLYPWEKVRDKDWVRRMGFTPSIMDYVRFDYVAQPEDGIPPEDLVARVGPYDRWAIHWGYAPVPGAATPEAEKPVLDRWAREQDSTPWLRYTTVIGWAGSADAGELAEAVGDEDAVQSTALGLRNLKRLEKMLIPATTAQTGEPLDDLAEMYGALVGQMSVELSHVVAIVGGATSEAKHAGQTGRVYTPISAARQKAAVAFLSRNAFATPAWLIDPEVLRRIESAGALDLIRNLQAGVLNNLLDSGRFARLAEQYEVSQRDTGKSPAREAWAPVDFLAAVRTGVWTELTAPRVKIDAWRRNLQRAYLDLAISRINGADTEEKSLYRAELKSLDAEIAKAASAAADRATKAHLETSRVLIDQALDPRLALTGAGAAPGNRAAIAAAGAEPPPAAASAGSFADCFPDYFSAWTPPAPAK